ncbi:uncharacterized protein LOC111365667 [Olea europaea var. sylvestris]|uniref:uncharacterized protein LOC111365667 n=1 Tax=Olea europaea var. sylvestris TaxID=158386 RepID=UPI000C1CEBAE|nr:uncharacterized protein LOC111365667 [Olea europaea var. sylvestris]
MDYVRKCEVCQVHTNFIHHPPESLHPTVASWLFDACGLDVIGPITSKSLAGHTYIFGGTNYFSKWTEAVPLKEVKKKISQISFVFKSFIDGVPWYIITDNDKPLCNSHINNLCAKFGFKQYNSSIYNAAANRLTEMFKKILCSLLKKVVSRSKKD